VTYTPSKFPPATVLNAGATYTAIPAAGVAFSLTGGGTGGLGTWGATAFTLSKAGEYIATAYFDLTNDASSGSQIIAIQKGGVTQGNQTNVFRAASQSSSVGVIASFTGAVSDSITLLCVSKSGATIINGTGVFNIRFIPTAAFPQ